MGATYLLVLLIVLALAFFLIYLRLKKSASDGQGKPTDAFEVLEVTLSRNDEEVKDIQTFSLAAENMFASLHGLLKEDSSKQEHFSFEVAFSGKEGIKFYVTVPTDVLKFVEGQIYAQYPDASIRTVPDYTKKIDVSSQNYDVVSLSFDKPNFFPIKVFRDMEFDPLSAFTSSLSHVDGNEEVWFQLVIKPIADIWQNDGFSYVNMVRQGLSTDKNPNFLSTTGAVFAKEAVGIVTGVFTGLFINKDAAAEVKKTPPAKEGLVRLSPTQELAIRSIENKLTRVGFAVVIRILSSANTTHEKDSNLRALLASLKQYSVSGLNNFSVRSYSSNKEGLNNYISRSFEPEKSLLLNSEELATIYHFPGSHIDTPNISWSYSRKSEPPANLPTKDCVFLGDTVYRSKRVRFGLPSGNDRLRHMYVIGKSGVGKSTLFEVMLMQDIANGEGVCVLDPHGETIDKVLEYIPENRIEDVIYVDPYDTDRPIGLNLLEIEDPSQKNILASGLLAAIKQHFDYSWGPRLEYLLNYALLTLLEVPGTTMLSITRLLEDRNYRNYILHFVQDAVVKRFWEGEYKEQSNNPRFITEAISPIQNKVNRFLASSTIRNLLGQSKSTINFWDIMQNKKILLINLSKGKIGADNANLLGALLVSRIQFYALQRSRIPDSERVPFYLYVDEFQNFAGGSFEEILSESRKYKLGLYLTHQFTAQLPEPLLKAVLGNVGTIVTFSSGAGDAQLMANEFAPFTQEDIITLQKFYVYMKLMIDGMTSLPFSAKILTPWEDAEFLPKRTGNKEKVIARSREKYGTDREYVEAKITKWVETPFDKGLAIAREMHDKGDGGANLAKNE